MNLGPRDFKSDAQITWPNCLHIENDGSILCSKFSCVTIFFQWLQMKLLTKQGIIKSQTECAPNNGYFLIPLYDKVCVKLVLLILIHMSVKHINNATTCIIACNYNFNQLCFLESLLIKKLKPSLNVVILI